MPKQELSKEKIWQKITAYCAMAEYCESEVREKLVNWGLPIEQHEELITYLTDNGFLNSKRYCQAYAHDKFAYQGWGKHKIRLMLSSKALPNKDIEFGLSEINEHEYKEKLAKILQAKRTKYDKEKKPMQKRIEREKLIRFAMGRGFEYEIILQIL